MRPAIRRLATVSTCVVGLCTLSSGASQAQELGRLFLSPAQREALDARRAAKVPDKPPPAAVVQSPTATVDGRVTRSGGPPTIWINGQPISEGSRAEGIKLRPTWGDAAGVAVSIGETEKQVRMKVGETLNRDTGEVRDVLGGGKIRVGPRPRDSRR